MAQIHRRNSAGAKLLTPHNDTQDCDIQDGIDTAAAPVGPDREIGRQALRRALLHKSG